MTSSTESVAERSIGDPEAGKRSPVGLIGVGVMGRCMLTRLIEAGHDVVAFDLSESAREFASGLGAHVVEGTPAVVSQADVLILSLPASAHVLSTVRTIEPFLTSRHIIVDTSTVDPATSKEGARIAGLKGARYVDAPILGRPSAAGKWLLPSGGPEDAIINVRPILETFARSAVRVGDTGTGNAFKLLNQLMFSVINGISAEVMALADTLGIDRRTFYDVVANSGAATVSGLFKETAGRIVDERFDDPTFTVELLVKDAGLGLEMAKSAGLNPQIAGFVQSINESAKAMGFARLDTSALYTMFRESFTKDAVNNHQM